MSDSRCSVCGAKVLGAGGCPICALAGEVVKNCDGAPRGVACHGCIARALAAAWKATEVSIKTARKERWWSFWRVK